MCLTSASLTINYIQEPMLWHHGLSFLMLKGLGSFTLNSASCSCKTKVLGSCHDVGNESGMVCEMRVLYFTCKIIIFWSWHLYKLGEGNTAIPCDTDRFTKMLPQPKNNFEWMENWIWMISLCVFPLFFFPHLCNSTKSNKRLWFRNGIRCTVLT